MGENIEIIEKGSESSLEIKAQAAMWKMPMVMGKAFGSISKYLESKGIESAGAPYARYLNINWNEADEKKKFLSFIKMFTKKWDMRIGFPVKEKVEGNALISSGTIPAGRYMKTIHKGPYKYVGNSYKQLISYMQQQKISSKNECVEIYMNDPRKTKKEDLETIILVPISEN